MFLILSLYRGSIRRFMSSVRLTFYSTVQRLYEDMTHTNMPKIFLKGISVQLMAQLTQAVVIEHMPTFISKMK